MGHASMTHADAAMGSKEPIAAFFLAVAANKLHPDGFRLATNSLLLLTVKW